MRTRRSAFPLLLLCSALALAACGTGSGTAPGGESSSSPSASATPGRSPSPASASPGSPSAPPPAAPDTAAAATSLTVEFSADGQNTTDTWTLQCDGAIPLPGSNVPDPAAACAVLAEQGTALFAEAASNTMCTQNIVGMQRARVSGTVSGEAVEASFALTDGCQISRWEKLTGLLGPAEGTL